MVEKYINKFKESKFWKKLAKNVMTVLIGNGGSSIINFFVMILLVRLLGNTDYGLLLIAIQYMNLIDGIVNFQSWVGVIKYGSEAIIDEDDDKLGAVFKSGFFIDVITALLGAVIAFCVLPIAIHIMKWDYDIALIAAVFSIEIIFHVEGTSVGILRLFDKFNLTASQSIISGLVKLVFIGIYALFGGKSLVVVSIIYMVTDVFKHLLLVIMALCVLHKQFGMKKVVRSSFKSVGKGFFKYTIWNNISYTVDVPVRYFDVFIISLVSVEMVSIYKVFRQIIQILSMLTSPISQAILPQFSELIALKKQKEALKKVLKLRNAILIVGIIVVFAAAFVGKPLLNIFFGNEYGENIVLFLILLVIQIGLTSYVAIHPFFASLGVARQGFIIILVSNLIYMLVAFLFVGRFGIYAVVIATGLQGYLCIFGKYFYATKFIANMN